MEAADPQSYTVIGDIIEPEDPEHPVLIQRAGGDNVPLQPGGFDHFDDEA